MLAAERDRRMKLSGPARDDPEDSDSESEAPMVKIGMRSREELAGGAVGVMGGDG